jgi:anti-sigma B factor antagonist
MQLMARCQRCGDAAVVRFEGEVDLAVAAEFDWHLKAGLDVASTQPGRLLIIDLDGVTFFACTGLRAVLTCHEQGANDGIAVGLVSKSSAVVEVIKATRLDEILTVYSTIDDALNALKPTDGITST